MGNARCQPRATPSGDHGIHSQSAVKSLMQGTDIQGEVKPKAFPVQFKAERLPFKITGESKTFAFASLKGCVLFLFFSFTLKALPSSKAVQLQFSLS